MIRKWTSLLLILTLAVCCTQTVFAEETAVQEEEWESSVSETAEYPEEVISDETADETAEAEEDLTLQQAASDGVTVTRNGIHDYGRAASMLPMVNELRKSQGCGALTLDRELTDAAMQRAAEIAVSFDHTRPNMTSCFTVCDKAHGENIAAGNDTAEDTYLQWYHSPGHYANMINSSYRSIGIGHFECEGISYWVQLFSWDEAEQAETRTGSVRASRNIELRDTPPDPDIIYQTHVQKIGWQDPVKDGAMSGTEGRSLRLEGIRISLSDSYYSGDIEYRTHVQTYGWQGWRMNGDMAGTWGESKRLEAIQIRLSGDLANNFDVWYQTHIQHFGWSGWACNGAQCGSAGYSYRLEGIRIKLVKKGSAAPGSTANPFYQKAGASSAPAAKMTGAAVGYNTHVQTYGWQPYVYDGDMAGTQGESKRLEGIHIELIDKPYPGDIVYRTHIQTYGWEPYWMGNGEMSGTSGEAKRLEGIQIFLTDEMAEHYDVYYCVHAQTYGWLDWAKNGEMAGTSGLAKRLEGIRIRLVPKGGAAPGATARPNVVGRNGSLPYNPYDDM